jgi:hypothetical protein
MRRVVRLAAPSGAARAVEVVLSGESGAGWIVTDATRFKLALMLLLGAAVDCIADGVIAVAVTRHAGRNEVGIRVAFDGQAFNDVPNARVALDYCRRLVATCEGTLADTSAASQVGLTLTLPCGDAARAGMTAR